MNPCFQAQCMLRSPFQSKYDSYTPKTTLNRLVTHSHYVILLQYLCKNKHCSLGIGFFFFSTEHPHSLSLQSSSHQWRLSLPQLPTQTKICLKSLAGKTFLFYFIFSHCSLSSVKTRVISSSSPAFALRPLKCGVSKKCSKEAIWDWIW